MTDLSALYQEVILDHNRTPRNRGELPGADHRAEGNNPLCGDQLTVTLRLADGRIDDIRFQGQGCAISVASASLMTEAVRGQTAAEANRLFESFRELLTGDPSLPAEAPPELGKLAVFAGVREFPIRVKCATLPWHTLKEALGNGSGIATTE